MEDIFRYLDRAYRVLDRERQEMQEGKGENGVGKSLGFRCHVVGPREGWDLTEVSPLISRLAILSHVTALKVAVCLNTG